jgi:hypothetical protein
MGRTSLDFEYNGKEYSLCYTIDVIRKLDKAGVIAGIQDHPLTAAEDLFIAAFEAKHPDVSNRIRREIYAEFSETSEDGTLLDVLVDMIMEVKAAMTPKGNVKWKVNRG